MGGRPEHTSRLAEAGRGWRPAAAGGRPEPEFAPAGRARWRMGRRLWAAAFHIGVDRLSVHRFAPSSSTARSALRAPQSSAPEVMSR